MQNLVDFPFTGATYEVVQTFPMRQNLPVLFVLSGDLVYFVGQLTSESVTSTVGAVFVILSTLVTLYLRFKKEGWELQRDQETKDREARRIQDEKDLHLKCKIEETRDLTERVVALERKIESLESENTELEKENKDFKRLFDRRQPG